MSSSSMAGPSRRANIIRVIPQTSGFAQAFRKLVSRALCVQLPTSEWTVGYYRNPLNPTDKVLVFSSSATSPVKCLIIREDMSCMETVGGFRRDRVMLERVMSSLHLERILQGLHAASTCPGWAAESRRRPPNTLQRGRSFHATNCWGLLDPTMTDTTICPPCSTTLIQTKHMERVEIPSDVLIDQKKTVQRFRTRLRVHLCRAKQLLKKKQQQLEQQRRSDVDMSECSPADNDASAPVDETVEEKVKHHDVRISFEHGATRYTVVLDKLYQLPPPIFQGAMRVMAGSLQTPAATISACSTSSSSSSSNRSEATAEEPTVSSGKAKKRKLERSFSGRDETMTTASVKAPACGSSHTNFGNESASSKIDDDCEQRGPNPAIATTFGTLSQAIADRRDVPLCRDSRADAGEQVDDTHFVDEHTMVLQIEQVLNDGRLETRKIYVNGASSGGALAMFQDGGAALPRHLQDAIQQLFTSASCSTSVQPQHISENIPASITTTTMTRTTLRTTNQDAAMEPGSGDTERVVNTLAMSTDDDAPMEAGDDDDRGDDRPCRIGVIQSQVADDHCSATTASVQAQVVVDLGEGLPSEHVGLPLEAMQLQIDPEQQL